jgi:hypothetical protein
MIEITSPVELPNARLFSSKKSKYSNISYLIILYATEFRLVILEVDERQNYMPRNLNIPISATYMHFATEN